MFFCSLLLKYNREEAWNFAFKLTNANALERALLLTELDYTSGRSEANALSTCLLITSIYRARNAPVCEALRALFWSEQ